MRTRILAAGFLMVAWMALSAAQAEDAPEPIRIDVNAAGTCADRSAFESAVRRRTARSRPALDGEAARRFELQVRGEEQRWTGSLTIHAKDGATSDRRVTGASCAEVVDALALVAALAIDPQALVRAPPQPETPAPEPAGSATSPPPPTASPTETPRAPPSPVVASAERPSRTQDERWSAGLGAQVAATWGPAPDALVTLPVFVEVARGQALQGRLTLARGRSDTVESSSGSGRFTWTVGRLEGCTTLLRGSWGGRVIPCALVEGGTLQGQGAEVDRPRAETRGWFAAGLTLRLQAPLFRELFVEGQGAVAAPIVRDRFFLEPDTTLHQVPVVVPSAAFGLGAHFL